MSRDAYDLVLLVAVSIAAVNLLTLLRAIVPLLLVRKRAPDQGKPKVPQMAMSLQEADELLKYTHWKPPQ